MTITRILSWSSKRLTDEQDQSQHRGGQRPSRCQEKQRSNISNMGLIGFDDETRKPRTRHELLRLAKRGTQGIGNDTFTTAA